MPLSTCRKEPSCSWFRPVPTCPPDSFCRWAGGSHLRTKVWLRWVQQDLCWASLCYGFLHGYDSCMPPICWNRAAKCKLSWTSRYWSLQTEWHGTPLEMWFCWSYMLLKLILNLTLSCLVDPAIIFMVLLLLLHLSVLELFLKPRSASASVDQVQWQ